MTYSLALQEVDYSQFLIIGSGNELRGDDAAGRQVADAVADWRLPSVKAISTPKLTTALVNDMAMAHYVIFVDALSDRSQARTVQLCPIVLGSESSQKLPKETSGKTHRDHPLALLSLTEVLYGRSPQAWWLRVPTERFGEKEELSKTAERGCDRALTTITQFLKTYQQPAEIGCYISAQSRQHKDYQRPDHPRKEASSKALALVPQRVA